MTAAGPLVSAVIPVFNGETFVAEAIESVLAQTYRPLECVVVDDGSTDGTARVLSTYGPRITSLRRPRGGVAAARNAGAGAARGELLAFLDADDLWEPTKIERQVTLLREDRALGLVYCGLAIIDGDGRHLGSVPAPDPSIALRNTLLDEPPPIGLAQTAVIPREVFRAVGGFDERLSTSADSDLAWRLAVRYRIAAVDEPLARYRRHPGQMHLDAASFAHDHRIVLRKAFASGLLPAELRGLERRARSNMAFSLAYAYRREHRARALAHLCHAFWLTPRRSLPWVASFARRRLERAGSPRTD